MYFRQLIKAGLILALSLVGLSAVIAFYLSVWVFLSGFW